MPDKFFAQEAGPTSWFRFRTNWWLFAVATYWDGVQDSETLHVVVG